MLARARAQSAGLPVDYRLADATALDLGERFGFALLTGHAFQAFLTDDDQRAVLAGVARHLRPGGGFAFETRNPAASADRRGDHRLGAPLPGRGRAPRSTPTPACRYDAADRRPARRPPPHDLATGAERSSRIALRYSDDAHVRRLLAGAGLRIAAAFGDWTARPSARPAPELIYVCERP